MFNYSAYQIFAETVAMRLIEFIRNDTSRVAARIFSFQTKSMIVYRTISVFLLFYPHVKCQGNIPAALWNWIGGSNQPDQMGEYGTQGVPNSTNIPSARSAHQMIWDSKRNKLILFGGFARSSGQVRYIYEL